MIEKGQAVQTRAHKHLKEDKILKDESYERMGGTER